MASRPIVTVPRRVRCHGPTLASVDDIGRTARRIVAVLASGAVVGTLGIVALLAAIAILIAVPVAIAWGVAQAFLS